MVVRNDSYGNKLYQPLVMQGLMANSLAKTVAANEALLITYPPVLLLDPNGGAKDVLLPTEATSVGLMFFIYNTADAAESLVVKEDSDTTAIVTLTQGTGAIVHCDGTTWRLIASSLTI